MPRRKVAEWASYRESEGPAIRKVLTEARKSRLSSGEQRELLRLIKKRMDVSPNFFARLEPLFPPNVRRFREGKVDVVIKHPEFLPSKNEYIKFYKAYQKALKAGEIKPNKYVLVPLKPYGIIEAKQVTPITPTANFKEKFVVMEHNVPLLAGNRGGLDFEPYDEILPELEKHLEFVGQKYGIRVPQYQIHVLFLGNTRPKNPEKGKWVIALPHDYG